MKAPLAVRAALMLFASWALCHPSLAEPACKPSPQPGPAQQSAGESLDDPRWVATPFQRYLTYQRYRVQNPQGLSFEGGFVHGPGHHISAMAALVFDERGTPYATFKTGDTRLSRALRHQPYVATSGIAGRWDKLGASAVQIVLDELSEEIGGSPVPGTLRRLGDSLSPTMPNESTESDEYFCAAVELTGEPSGDGGQMEVVGLIGPLFLSPQEAIAAMDEGRISDAARARTMFGRAWDSLGYLPDLDLYVHDTAALSARFDSLGLGPTDDLRDKVISSRIPPPKSPKDSPASQVNAVLVESLDRLPLDNQVAMVDARIRHAVQTSTEKTPVGPSFASQYLQTSYDRAKVAVYYLDAEQGPMVEMGQHRRPALAFAPGSLSVTRRDLRDIQVPKTRAADLSRKPGRGASWESLRVSQTARSGLPGPVFPLAQFSAASSGQSDLFYWSYACLVEPPQPSQRGDFVSLAEALRLCRSGHGDAQSEATLLRLAQKLEWIPQLGLSVEEARVRASSPLRRRR